MKWWKNVENKCNIEIGGQKQYLTSCSFSTNIKTRNDQKDEEWVRLKFNKKLNLENTKED